MKSVTRRAFINGNMMDIMFLCKIVFSFKRSVVGLNAHFIFKFFSKLPLTDCLYRCVCGVQCTTGKYRVVAHSVHASYSDVFRNWDCY
jgi:hypothetical protein